ncbi:MAG: peroxide stress protein YaaA [Flavobacteriaceae bacterium]|nr:peroxide stress protein YaaA [Flavobacteriaceae bacterium]
MKMIISPAKSIDNSKELVTKKNSLPFFLEDAVKINSFLKLKSPNELSSLMNISDKLSELNWRRNQEFNLPFNQNNSRPAIYSFNGDVYSGIDSFSIPQNKIGFLQENLIIISGLYGLLKPLDLIQPYRLEMGTKLKFEKYDNLYKFWKEKITDQVKKWLYKEENLLNLASNEYFSVLDLNKISTKIITPQFKDFKNGTLKMISFYAKKARGLMVRYIIDNEIKDYEGIIKFNLNDYSFSSEETKDINNPVFVR